MNKYIMLVGKICGDDFDWTIAPLPVEADDVDAKFDAPADFSYFAHLFQDGSLERVIEYGARLSEEEDARLDEEFNRRGGWL